MIPSLVLIPLIVGIITQGAKFIWRAAAGSFSLHELSFYGGMPSAHTAITTSLITVLGFQEGIDSSAFAVAVVFGILVVRDAIGFRRYIGNHSHALNRIVQHLPRDGRQRFPLYRETLGHTPLEAFMGAIIGFTLSAVLYLAFL